MISIIDYKMGNTRSVFNAFKLLGENVEITNEKDRLTQAEAIVLPGVGSFNDGMKDLNQNGLKEFLTEEIIDRKKPYLGICLGLEFLAKRSYEGGVCDGFGRVTWFRDKDGDGLGTFMEWITSCTYPTDMEIEKYQHESLLEGGGDQGR